MDEDHHQGPGWVRLPAYHDEGGSAPGSGRTRASGVRQVRRASAWTVAALITSLAAAVGYFAHHTQPTVPAATTVTPGAPGNASTVSGGKPVLPSPVVTSSGSAVSGGDDRGDN